MIFSLFFRASVKSIYSVLSPKAFVKLWFGLFNIIAVIPLLKFNNSTIVQKLRVLNAG